jgi:hypothetical protein
MLCYAVTQYDFKNTLLSDLVYSHPFQGNGLVNKWSLG